MDEFPSQESRAVDLSGVQIDTGAQSRRGESGRDLSAKKRFTEDLLQFKSLLILSEDQGTRSELFVKFPYT